MWYIRPTSIFWPQMCSYILYQRPIYAIYGVSHLAWQEFDLVRKYKRESEILLGHVLTTEHIMKNACEKSHYRSQSTEPLPWMCPTQAPPPRVNKKTKQTESNVPLITQFTPMAVFYSAHSISSFYFYA